MLTLHLDLNLQFPMRWWIVSQKSWPNSEHFTETEGGYIEVSCDSLYNVDFLTGISYPHCSFLNSHLYQKSQMVPWTFRHNNQNELLTIHQVLLKMIRVKEKRDLAGILNYADSIFPQCLFYSNLSYFLLQKTDVLGTSQVVNIIEEL